MRKFITRFEPVRRGKKEMEKKALYCKYLYGDC